MFQSKSFNCIESCVRPTIKELTQQSINRALNGEIEEKIKNGDAPKSKTEHMLDRLNKKSLEKDDVPLTVCYDMGWNKRSSGTRYDSISGHGLMIGGYSKKVLGMKCFLKK